MKHVRCKLKRRHTHGEHDGWIGECKTCKTRIWYLVRPDGIGHYHYQCAFCEKMICLNGCKKENVQ